MPSCVCLRVLPLATSPRSASPVQASPARSAPEGWCPPVPTPPHPCLAPAPATGVGMPLPMVPPHKQLFLLATGGSVEDRAKDETPARDEAHVIEVGAAAAIAPAVSLLCRRCHCCCCSGGPAAASAAAAPHHPNRRLPPCVPQISGGRAAKWKQVGGMPYRRVSGWMGTVGSCYSVWLRGVVPAAEGRLGCQPGRQGSFGLFPSRRLAVWPMDSCAVVACAPPPPAGAPVRLAGAKAASPPALTVRRPSSGRAGHGRRCDAVRRKSHLLWRRREGHCGECTRRFRFRALHAVPIGVSSFPRCRRPRGGKGRGGGQPSARLRTLSSVSPCTRSSLLRAFVSVASSPPPAHSTNGTHRPTSCDPFPCAGLGSGPKEHQVPGRQGLQLQEEVPQDDGGALRAYHLRPRHRYVPPTGCGGAAGSGLLHRVSTACDPGGCCMSTGGRFATRVYNAWPCDSAARAWPITRLRAACVSCCKTACPLPARSAHRHSSCTALHCREMVSSRHLGPGHAPPPLPLHRNPAAQLPGGPGARGGL